MFTHHYNFREWKKIGITRCYLCRTFVSDETAVSYTGKGWSDNIECHVCRTPVCEDCATIFWDNTDDELGRRYKLCRTCSNTHPEIESVETLLKTLPEGHGCFVCQKRAVGNEKSFAANPLNISACMRCYIPACPDCLSMIGNQKNCKKCGEEIEKNKFTCPICNKTSFKEQMSLCNCNNCGREFCIEHKAVRRLDGKIRNVCPDCVAQTTPV